MSFMKKVNSFVQDTANQARKNILCEPYSEYKTGQAVLPGTAGCRDTVVVIDRSGSMELEDYEPSRLQGGKQAAGEYVNRRLVVCCQDRVAVVSFGHTAKIELGLTDITDRETITEAINNIQIKGGTDIAKGIKAATAIFQKHQKCPNQRHLILLTDGCGGHPIRKSTYLKQQLNCIIDAVGIGGSRKEVNEKLLRKVATTDPDGFNHYRFISDSSSLKQHYSNLAKSICWRPKK